MFFFLIQIEIITHIEVEVMAILRTYPDVAHLQVFITEHLFYSRQTISLLVRNLRLQLWHNEICPCDSITESVFRACCLHELSRVLIDGYRSRDKEIVIFRKDRYVLHMSRHETILKTRDVLAGTFCDRVGLFLNSQQ